MVVTARIDGAFKDCERRWYANANPHARSPGESALAKGNARRGVREAKRSAATAERASADSCAK